MDTFFLKTPPESVFPHGVWIPFATEEEALRQAAWDLQETDRIEGLFRAPSGVHQDIDEDISASALLNAYNVGDPITKEVVPYSPSKKLEKLYTTAALQKKAKSIVPQVVDEAAKGWEDYLRSIHDAVKRGNEPRAVSPGNAYSIVSGGTATAGAVALAAATAKTVIGLAAGANNAPCIIEAALSFDGVTATAVPVLTEWVSGTNATNPPGTASTTMTPKQLRGVTAASVATAAYAWSTEPTVLEVYKKRFLTPYGGLLVMQYPLGREVTGQVAAATQLKFLGLRLTAPAIVNTHVDLEYEE